MKLRVSPLVSLVALLLVFFSPILQANSEDSGNSPKFNEVLPNFKDISYGSHPKELINFWQFDSDQPVGVLLQIHGGGWMGGKKMKCSGFINSSKAIISPRSVIL